MKVQIASAALLLALAGAACGGESDEPGEPGETITVTETVTETVTVPATDGTETPSPSGTSCDTLDNGEELAFIFVSSPLAGAQVSGDTITVEGCSNTFEAGYTWELVDRDGNVVADGFGQATCGTGCVGTFSFDITHGLSERQVVYIHVFDLSAEDGSRELESVVPVVVGG
jgi:hypothetical protein